MQVILHGTESSKDELLESGIKPGCDVVHLSSINELYKYSSASVIIDLGFEEEKRNTAALKDFKGLVIVASVTKTLGEINDTFIRINAWPGFLKGSLVEVSCLKEDVKEQANIVLDQFGKTAEWLPDEPGFVTPRVISMIINEAYFALGEGVSSKEEIDTAMKLGTAYPYGPFEWAEKNRITKRSGVIKKLEL